ncbi:hypothetical protein V2J09_004209 [Rumex salicifolius]
MATAEEVEMSESSKEGKNLLGSPTFRQLENGRFKCVETGHELPQHAIDSYSNSKRCRLGLIDFALSKKKPPLNMFNQDPFCRSKLICKLTGDSVNKSEEHIWKHINGKRFLNKLEQMEAGTSQGDGKVEQNKGKHDNENGKEKKNKKKKEKKKKKKEKEMGSEKKMEEIVTDVGETPNDSDIEEAEFWMPPVGERWDFDDGRDRWDSGSESEGEHEEDGTGTVDDEENNNASADLSLRTKRMSIEVGPSSFASRKKKISYIGIPKRWFIVIFGALVGPK